MKILVSFDIDGTLEVGYPPGPVTLDMVKRARETGCIIGTSSDRPLSVQKELMNRQHIHMDFVSLKHKLSEVREFSDIKREGELSSPSLYEISPC